MGSFGYKYRMTSSNDGVGITTVLFIVFLVLKLVGVINWSWWWVTSPLWIHIGILLLTIFIVIIISAIKP